MFELGLLDGRPPRGGKVFAHLGKLGLEDAEQASARRQNVQVLRDLAADGRKLFPDLLALEPGQSLQAQLQDGTGLGVRQAVFAVLDGAPGLVDKRDQGRHIGGQPGAGEQPGSRFGRVPGGADERDHGIEVRNRDREAGQHVGALARLAELENGAPPDDVLAEGDEGGDDLLQVHQHRLAAVERQHVDAEADLQRRVSVELVENHLGHRVALDLDHHAHAAAIGFVAQIRDPLDLFLVHELGDHFDHARLVQLIGNLGDDDGRPVLADLLEGGAPAQQNDAAPAMEAAVHAGRPHDDAAGGEVGRGHVVLHHLLDRDLGFVDVGDAGVDHLAQVVGRDVGGHADRDPAGAIDQEVGKARRQHHRLAVVLVVVGAEVDRVLIDVLDQGVGRTVEPRLGVAHGRRPVAVHGAEVALAVDQGQAHRKRLRHAHHGVVNGRVPVRVVLAHHLADDARRLAVRAVRVIAALVHGIDDAAVDGFQAVAHVGQRAADDHAHGVIEIRAAHLVLDGDRGDVELRRRGRLLRWRQPI